MTSATALPDARSTRNALLAGGLRAFWVANGFEEMPGDDGSSTFSRTLGDVTLQGEAWCFGKARPACCDARLLVRIPQVQAIVALFDPDTAHPWTASLSVAKWLGLRHFELSTRDDYQAFIDTAKAQLPFLLQAGEGIRSLDRFVNGDRVDTSGDDWSTYISRSSIVLAYLAGNPNVDTMIEEADGRQLKAEGDALGSVGRLAAYLRNSVWPVVREPGR